jgi:hypothetical protein
MSKESLTRSKTGGTGGGRRAPSAGTKPVKGNPAELEKKSEPEVVRFNWSEVDEDKSLYEDPENHRRKIPLIVAKFPQKVIVSIYGSHFDKKSDRKTTHLVHKNRDVLLEPYRPDEAQYSWKSHSPLTAHPAPLWASLISWDKLTFFSNDSGTWSLVRGDGQKMRGDVYKRALQRSKTGSFKPQDADITCAFRFIGNLVKIDLKPDSLSLDRLRRISTMQHGLWNGLLPALMKGKFTEIEAAFRFAREVEEKRIKEKLFKGHFTLEEHFPTAIHPYEIALKECVAMLLEEDKAPIPSVTELLDHCSKKDFTGSLDPKSFRDALCDVGLSWLKENRKLSKRK